MPQALAAPLLGEHCIEHLDDEALLGSRQLLDTFDLSQQLWRGTALGRRWLLSHELLDRDAKEACYEGQGGNGHTAAADFVGVDGPLRDTEPFGELHLGDGLGLAGLGDASAEMGEEGLLVIGGVEVTIDPVYRVVLADRTVRSTALPDPFSL